MALILILMSLLSLGIVLWQFWEGLRFPLQSAPSQNNGEHQPSITLLKPLKGVDPFTFNCMESWILQDYSGTTQILFGVASSQDPVCKSVMELQQKYPARDIQLLICSTNLAINAKVSSLIQLEPYIKNEMVIISDADVHVPSDFLTQISGSYRDNPGLINCLYRHANPSTLSMHLEAIAMNADFWSQVAQSLKVMEMDYALGAVMATSKEWLRKIGGFRAIGDYLADDFQLGHQIHKKGGKILLSHAIVDCYSPPMALAQVWKHQLRWARTIRHCKPMPYALSILSNSTIWPVMLAALHPLPISWMILGISVALRSMTAVWLQIRFEKTARALPFFWLVPIKDLMQFLWWLLSFTGNRIEWRGAIYRIVEGGKLQRINLQETK